MKILINSYACCPGMGSEPGMGWNWISNIAQDNEVYVITEGEFREKIEKWYGDNAGTAIARNLHFYWNPVSEAIRKMCWNQGDWRFYIHYKKWQAKTADIAREICNKESIDILHQLNMIGFREPGYLWEVSRETGIPFVWGPIGGLKQFPMAYAKGSGLKMRTYLWTKNIVNLCQIKFGRRVDCAIKQASALISSIPDSYDAIKRYKGMESVIIPETGCFPDKSSTKNIQKAGNDEFIILWIGKFDYRKQLGIALSAIAKCKECNVKLIVFGSGNNKQTLEAEKQAYSLGIRNRVIWMGNCPNNKVLDDMKRADLFMFTSVSEDTSTVVLEAISNNLPVLCFDTCGMGNVITDKIGIKIPLSTPKKSASDFASAIKRLYSNRDLLRQYSDNCFKRAEELSWKRKTEELLRLYTMVINTGQKDNRN